MKKKQFLALALSAVMAGGMLAGCGSSNGSSSSSKSDAKDEVVTLKWIQVGNGMPKDYDEWLAQINPYLEEKIGVNVDMEIVPWGADVHIGFLDRFSGALVIYGSVGAVEEALSQTPASISISCSPTRTVTLLR